MEAQREFGNEVEDGRGIGRDADAMIGVGEDLRRRHSADIGQSVANQCANAGQLFDAAMAVLEPDQIRMGVA